MSARLTRRLIPIVAGAVVGAVTFVVPSGAAGPAKIDLDQCRNGSSTSPSACANVSGPTGWENGNAGTSQAHYVEGQSAPYRAVMENLPTGTPISVVLGYDVKQGGKHAIDFLTRYDRLEPHAGFGHAAEDVNPTDGVTGFSATVGTFPIPAPSALGSPVAGQPTAAFNALPSGERVMTLFGGTISAMAYVSEGSLAASQSDTQVSVTFTADNPTAVLAWGGHIAPSTVWGANNSASGLSGSPYHMRLVSWTLGNLGQTDRSLSAGAVFPSEPEPPAPAQLTVTKVVVNDDAGTAVVGDFDLFVDETQVSSGVAAELPAGSYTVSEGAHAGYTSTIGGDCAADGSISLAEGEVASCTITNDDVTPDPDPAQLTVTKVVVNDDAGTAVVGDFSLFVGETSVTSGVGVSLPAGSYTVSEGAHAGYTSTIGGDCAADGSISLAEGEVASCTITNDDVTPEPDPDPDPQTDPDPEPQTDPDPEPQTDPDPDPQVDPGVESSSETQSNNPPLQQPVAVLPAISGSGAENNPVAASELPRTGAGLRQEALLGLALLAVGLMSRTLGRRTRPGTI